MITLSPLPVPVIVIVAITVPISLATSGLIPYIKESGIQVLSAHDGRTKFKSNFICRQPGRIRELRN